MDILELIFTDIVLKRAIKLRRLEHTEDLSGEPPILDPYVRQAVQELRAWHHIVMEEVRRSPK